MLLVQQDLAEFQSLCGHPHFDRSQLLDQLLTDKLEKTVDGACVHHACVDGLLFV